MMFKRGSSFLALIFLAALLAACAYVAQRPSAQKIRSEAVIALMEMRAPVAVDLSHVVDGDTFHVFVTLGSGEMARAPVRIRGIDTPEMKGACEAESRAAREALQMLDRLLASGPIMLSEVSSDKYQRALARVYVRSSDGRLQDVAELMVAAGYGRIYEGRKRAGWCG